MPDLPASPEPPLDVLICCPCCTSKSPYAISGPITTVSIIASGDPTSIHKALEIPEILRHVYEILAQDNKKCTLVSMALVCRGFTESALDVIWYSLDGLTPLLSILPISKANGVMIVVFEDSNRYAWERFDTYANRVYKLTKLEDALDIQILRIHTGRAKKHCIFPNLQTLTIKRFIPPILLDQLITPSLRVLGVSSREDPNLPLPDHDAATVSNILNILTTPIHEGSETKESGQIQHLELNACIPSSCLDQLMSLRQLRVLNFLGVALERVGGFDYLQGLSTLPYLDCLGLNVEEYQFFRPVPCDGFPSLRELSLVGKSPNIKSVFCAIPSNRLTGVRITDSEFDWSTTVSGAEEMRTCLEEWRSCFSAMVQQAETLLVLGVTLSSNTANPDDIRSCALNLPMMSIVKPFLELRALNAVKLEGFIKLPYSDADIRDLAVAWPKIEGMALPPPLTEVMQPSLMSLRILSRFCPYLKILHMGLDVNEGTDVEPNSELLQQLKALPVVTSHGLTKLDVYESDLRKEDVTRLAGQLRDWFPLLRNVVAAQSGEVAAYITETLSQEM